MLKMRHKNKALQSARKLRRINAVRSKVKATTTGKRLPVRKGNKKAQQQREKK